MLDVAVCVATRRRPEGLRALLASLAAQELPPDVAVRVVVVENDDHHHPVVREIVEAADLEVDLLLEPRLGIPFARNSGVARAEGADLIAFVDDDEVAPSDWLRTHLAALDLYEADVTTGPVLPRFAHVPPRWVETSGLYDRRRWRTGHVRTEAYTGNLVCDARVLGHAPFDTSLALTGGSDTELFRRLARAGVRIIWVDEAPVWETVPPERTRLGWILRRGFRYGGDRWRRRTSTSPRPVERLIVATVAIIELLAGTAAAGASAPFSHGVAVRWLNRAARGAGMLWSILGGRFEEYRPGG